MNAVYEYCILSGKDALMNLTPSRALKRRYKLDTLVHTFVKTDIGRIDAYTEPGFIFDGRSGPRIADIIAPNLGSEEERVAWFMHDCLAYGDSLDFKETNSFLRCFLRDQAYYSSFRSWIIEKAVSISKSWYGPPPPNDWCICNVGKVCSVFTPRK